MRGYIKTRKVNNGQVLPQRKQGKNKEHKVFELAYALTLCGKKFEQ